MSSIGYVPLALGLLTFLLGGRLARGLAPSAIVKLGTALALTIAVTTGLVLAVAALLSFRAFQATERGGGSAVSALVPDVSSATGAVAAVVVLVLLASAARYFMVSARSLVRASADSRQLGPVRAGLIVVEDATPTAFAVAGAPGHVVVSTSMLQALDADERKVLLAHEAAHLHHHHHLYVQLARLAAAANPLLRPLSRVIADSTERWADELAAEEVGSRPLVARGLARAALARHGHAGSHAPLATLAAADVRLVERIDHLLAAPPRRSRLVSSIVLALVVACGAAGMASVQQAHHQIERLESVGAGR